MTQRFLVLIAVILSAGAACGSVHKIGPDLYAYISDNDSSANSTFLVSDQGILVVDTGLNAQEGRRLLDEIRKISSAPVRWIVNTHYHPDHRGGNIMVGPDAIVIATFETRSAVLRMQRPQSQPSGSGNRLATGYELSETFSGERGPTLYVGGHEVRIYHPGPAHTLGDTVVYFPDQHAIATGDLFLTNSCPAMSDADGDLENWIRALDQILALPVEHVVPGHFALAGKPELQRFRNYLADLGVQVKSMFDKRMSLYAVKKDLRLPKYKNFRQHPQYEATFADNAEAYYKQLADRVAK